MQRNSENNNRSAIPSDHRRRPAMVPLHTSTSTSTSTSTHTKGSEKDKDQGTKRKRDEKTITLKSAEDIARLMEISSRKRKRARFLVNQIIRDPDVVDVIVNQVCKGASDNWLAVWFRRSSIEGEQNVEAEIFQEMKTQIMENFSDNPKNT